MNRPPASDSTSSTPGSTRTPRIHSRSPACLSKAAWSLSAKTPAAIRARPEQPARASAAYQINDKTVFRGGYGVSYLPAFDPGTSLGYAVSTNFVSSTDGGLTPANTLSNPYPVGILTPAGSSLGLQTLLGQLFTFYDTDVRIPYVHQFSAGSNAKSPGAWSWTSPTRQPHAQTHYVTEHQ